MEMKENNGRRKLIVWIEKGHATWSMVSSKISVEGRHLRGLDVSWFLDVFIYGDTFYYRTKSLLDLITGI